MFHVVLRHVLIILEVFVHANAIFADDFLVSIFEPELIHAFVGPRDIGRRDLRGKRAARQRGQDERQGGEEQGGGFEFHTAAMINGEEGSR